jgi:putative PIG3 family NAD(P)H quinone oxidoreductase
MHAVTISSPGGPEALVWTEAPDPQPGPDEVVIDIVASAVNRADLLQRAGHYNPPPGASPYPGLECSGRVAALGADLDPDGDVRVGDEVCALLSGGGYAEKVAVPVGQLLPVPRNLSLVEAAALPEVACTVYSNVVQIAGLRHGETLLVHGGGSGIGTFAIQLGVALGVRVITTARAGKHGALRQLGAEVIIDYTVADFVTEVRKATDDHGADVILDIVGATYLARNVETLALNGRLAIIGMQGGRKAELDLGLLMAKRGSVSATTLRARPPQEKAEIVRGVREHIWPLVESGAIRPIVDRRVPMSQAAQAHRIVESSDHLGKVLLVTRAE